MSSTTIKWFESSHLPQPLREYAEKCADLAHWMEDHLTDGPEKSAGMRHLLEAKDCFVRARLDEPKG